MSTAAVDPKQLQTIIEDAWEKRDTINTATQGPVRTAVQEALAGLDDGAMRVAEEIDAVESMAVHSVSYLVSTRIIAGLIAVIPLYALAVLASFFAARATTVYINGQSAGLYDHYFSTFMVPTDLLWSFLQAIVMSVAVMLVHTYYGYNASGGPVGVGIAVGQAVRTSLIVVVTIVLLISLAVYGASGNFNLSG